MPDCVAGLLGGEALSPATIRQRYSERMCIEGEIEEVETVNSRITKSIKLCKRACEGTILREGAEQHVVAHVQNFALVS